MKKIADAEATAVTVKPPTTIAEAMLLAFSGETDVMSELWKCIKELVKRDAIAMHDKDYLERVVDETLLRKHQAETAEERELCNIARLCYLSGNWEVWDDNEGLNFATIQHHCRSKNHNTKQLVYVKNGTTQYGVHPGFCRECYQSAKETYITESMCRHVHSLMEEKAQEWHSMGIQWWKHEGVSIYCDEKEEMQDMAKCLGYKKDSEESNDEAKSVSSNQD